MSHIALFRTLVALSLCLSLASGASELVPPAIPEDWKTLLEWSGNDGVFEWLSERTNSLSKPKAVGLLILLLAVLGLMVYAQIGIFLFWRKARGAYALVTIGSVILAFFDGLVVVLPSDAALCSLSLLMDGAVIAMAFLPPVKARFEQSAPNDDKAAQHPDLHVG